MTKDEAMKLALEALGNSWTEPGNKQYEFEKEAITALREALANEALDKMAENARELGLDYEPSAGTQVSKVWWDGERLMAKPIPLDDFYEPAKQEPKSNLKQVIELYDSPDQPAQQEPVAFEEWLAKQHGDPEEIGFLQALRISYIAGQDSITSPPVQQEPWCMKMNGCKTKCEDCPDYVPPAAQRTWVGLTEQEQGAIMEDLNTHGTNLYPFAQAIEAKLKDKNT